jgi:hypothetical protein
MTICNMRRVELTISAVTESSNFEILLQQPLVTVCLRARKTTRMNGQRLNNSINAYKRSGAV